MVYWLGWFFYAVSLVLAAAYMVLFILVCVVAVGADPFAGLSSMAALVVPAIVLSGLGRDALYILTGK
ncbi:MAG: hypothetical protein ACOYB4_08035 [Methyloceanibacter sp.]